MQSNRWVLKRSTRLTVGRGYTVSAAFVRDRSTREETYNSLCEMLAVDEDVNGVEMRARTSVQRDLVHDLPIFAREAQIHCMSASLIIV